MLNLLGVSVRHKSWGLGKIVEQSPSSVTVQFAGETKKLSYPNSFEQFLECSDPDLQKQIMTVIAQQKHQKESHMQMLLTDLHAPDIPSSSSTQRTKKRIHRENIAFKCNFCDGGINQNGIGFCKCCSDKLIAYNIDEAHHSWCSDEESQCLRYLEGDIDRAELDASCKGDDYVCYESQMLRNWTAFAGYILRGENKYRPMKLEKVQIGSLAILTTRIPYGSERDRFVFAVFLVDEAYAGDNRDEGYVTTSSEYKLYLPLKQAQKIRFWNYYHNKNSPEKIAWGQGLHRYISDIQAACILRDIVHLKESTPEKELARSFLTHFCSINGLNEHELPALEGALSRN